MQQAHVKASGRLGIMVLRRGNSAESEPKKTRSLGGYTGMERSLPMGAMSSQGHVSPA